MNSESTSSNQYTSELENLGNTYELALGANVLDLADAITGASQASIIGVGSGGSFTVASLLCNLHEAYTGRISRPSTPLEIICNPTLASTSPAFFISAEGENPDIVEALLRARHHSARAIHVLTNRKRSRLADTVATLTDVGVHAFELPRKDGYLATNSLLMDAVLIARAYSVLDPGSSSFPSSIDALSVEGNTVKDWVAFADGFAQEAVARRGLMIVYAPSLRPIAADLESKLSESALMFTQIADVRSFAHGRHLWIAERAADCAILVLIDPSLEVLWKDMHGHLPTDVPVCKLSISQANAPDIIAALVAELWFVALIAKWSRRDPGRPTVPDFGRRLYYADLSKLIARPDDSADSGEREKREILGARWPYVINKGVMRRAHEAYRADLSKQVFKSIIFDYDGTLCTSQERNTPPSEPIVEDLCRLTNGGVIVGIVSGRGGSMRDRLREGIPKSEWKNIHLGLYNGGWMTDLASEKAPDVGNSEFLNHVSRIVRQLQKVGVPIKEIKMTQPYQVSIRFRNGVDTEAMWFVLADALRQAGLDLSTMVRSRHSIDILAANVNKSHVVASLIQRYDLLPYEVLSIGDQGAWPGNDASLLEHHYSLSVDFPSRRMDRGWKFAPVHKHGVDATKWYMDRIHLCVGGGFRMQIDQPRSSAGTQAI